MLSLARFLALLLLVATAAAQETESLSTRQETALNKFIKALDHKDSDINSLMRMNFAVKDAFLAAAVKHMNSSDNKLPTFGDRGQTVIEFSDYQCGYCRRAFSSYLEELVADGEIKINIVELPVLGLKSETAARYAIAAWKLEKYEEFHRLMMSSAQQLDAESLDRIAAKANINVKALHKHINSEETTQILENNYSLALLLGVRGTPGFIVNGRLIRGALKKDEFLSLLEEDS